MSDPIFSPDGKFMWTGSDWIPAPPDQPLPQINMQDSVIAGDLVQNTTINMTQEKDLHNYMKTMVDSLSEGREEKAREIYELAKKINYETAVSLYENEYAVQIANAQIDAFELFFIKELKDKAPKTLTQMEKLISFSSQVASAKATGLELLQSKGDVNRVYRILGEIGIEYRGLKISKINNENMAEWAYKHLKPTHPAVASALKKKYDEVSQNDKDMVIFTIVGLIFLIIVFMALLSG
jgi:hypothetical protein